VKHENASLAFSADCFPNLRQLDTMGKFANAGTSGNDAFLFTAVLVPENNATTLVAGNGGKDCVFVLNDRKSMKNIQMLAVNDTVSIDVTSRSKQDGLVFTYENVTDLKTQENVADIVHLMSCSLRSVDTNGGKAENETDIVVISRDYQPCNDDLKLYIGGHTNVLNFATRGSYN